MIALCPLSNQRVAKIRKNGGSRRWLELRDMLGFGFVLLNSRLWIIKQVCEKNLLLND
jgi:hypothetical protein